MALDYDLHKRVERFKAKTGLSKSGIMEIAVAQFLSPESADAGSLSDLVRSTLRLRLDRIIIGEVRGGEALDMLKAWNTGHPGGIATLHANSAHGALFGWNSSLRKWWFMYRSG